MDGNTSVRLSGPDGQTLFEGSADEFADAAKKAAGDDKPRMKETDADREVRERAYSVTADELRQFVERYEQLEAEKKDIAEQQKELMAEAKGRGYDTKVMKKVVALRKRKPDDIAEEEAIMEMYKAALGMQ